MNDREVQLSELIVELRSLVERASRLQQDAALEAEAVREAYKDWYFRALPLIPEGKAKERFRDRYEGGEWTPRIKAFLADPLRPSPFEAPSEGAAKAGLSKWQYAFDTAFKPNANDQEDVLRECIATLPSESASSERSQGEERGGSCVFLVHGHDDKMKLEVARLVETMTQRTARILHEEPNSGRTVIEKLLQEAQGCDFAIALLSADDCGRATNDAEDQPRARQNVIFEAGYFLGLLGRDRLVLLYEDGVELPSDLSGVIVIKYSGSWQIELQREMKAAGIPIT